MLKSLSLVIALTFVGLSLSACTGIRTPGGTIKKDGYEIEIDGNNGYRSGPGASGHCPPGHAKKGWC